MFLKIYVFKWFSCGPNGLGHRQCGEVTKYCDRLIVDFGLSFRFPHNKKNRVMPASSFTGDKPESA